MRQGGLIAPIRETRHDTAIYARLHTGAHCRLVAPNRARPESPIGVANDRKGKASGRISGLARCTKGLAQELRQVSPGPNPEPRDRHEGRRLMASPVPDQPLLPLAIAPRRIWSSSKPNSRT